MKSITIDFAEDGSIKMEGSGFKGIECDKAMEKLEQSLGTKESRTNKPEYSQAQAQSARATARN
jgi:hypothetical protein